MRKITTCAAPKIVYRLFGLLCIAGMISPAYGIIAGKPESVSNWTSMLVLSTPSGLCSSVLVGPRVIATASHCLGEEKSAKVDWNNGGFNKITCETQQGASAEQKLDIALCLLEKEIAGKPERINTNSGLLRGSPKIHLAGFGCQHPGGIDASVGPLTVGEASLLLARQIGEQSRVATTEGAAVCFGDAGGGAFVYPSGASGERILVGIGVQGDIVSKTIVSLTSSTAFLDWARRWARENHVAICGLGDNLGCSPGTHAAPPEMVSANSVRSKLSDDEASLILPTPTDVTPPPPALKITARQNETVYDTISRACGAQPESYFLELDRRFGISASTTFGFERNVSIPICTAASPAYKIVTAKDGDSVQKLYDDTLTANQKSVWKAFKRLQGVSLQRDSEYFLDVFAALNPTIKDFEKLKGGDVVLPTAPLSKSVVSSRSVVKAPRGASEPIFAFVADSSSCRAPSGPPYDISAVLDVLRTNGALNLQQRAQAKVLIADTGLYGAGAPGIFSDKILLMPDNGTADIVPPLDDEDSGHGTQVASLVLGGPLFARMQAVFGPRIRIAMFPLYDTRSDGDGTLVQLKDQVFDKVITEAKEDYQVDIMNLSFKTQTPILAIERGSPDYLIVAAAGNYDGNLENNRAYPAYYGGASSRNVITVAATDGVDLAAWSNFGSNWVDIMAPGCAVPVLSYKSGNWQQELLSGTSLAAPLVSFTAALIKSEHPIAMNSAKLKRRIVVSADLHPTLDGKVVDGRILNIVKALALFQDTIEVSDGRLIFGNLVVSDGNGPIAEDWTFPASCKDGERSLKVSDLLKIWPHYGKTDDGKPLAKIYFKVPQSPDAPFLSKECSIPATVDFSIQERGKSAPTKLSIDEIVDIVRRL